MKENYLNTSNEVTEGIGFKEGKVFEAILNIMKELEVQKNGVELDKETGEVKYRYIKISDLRAVLKPLLIKNKCMIRKTKASKMMRDRKQNKWGTWVNIDVVENTYILQSLEDGSFIIGTGRGEGSDWSDSSCTLSEADAFKNFIGTTFSLVTDDDSEVSDDSITESEEPKKRKRRTKAEIEADKAKEKAESESKEATEIAESPAKGEPEIANPAVKLVAPEPTNEVVKAIDKNIDCEADGGVPLELPKEAFEEAEVTKELADKPVSVEPIEPVEKAEKEEPSPEVESVNTEAGSSDGPFSMEEPEEEAPAEEPTEETVSSDDEIKAFANVTCPVQNRHVFGKTFEEVCRMAITNNSESDIAARNCLVFVATHQEQTAGKWPEFAKACALAVAKFNLAA